MRPSRGSPCGNTGIAVREHGDRRAGTRGSPCGLDGIRRSAGSGGRQYPLYVAYPAVNDTTEFRCQAPLRYPYGISVSGTFALPTFALPRSWIRDRHGKKVTDTGRVPGKKVTDTGRVPPLGVYRFIYCTM